MDRRCEPGAPPPEGFVPLSVPEISGSEWRYVKECLDTNWVSSVGPFVDRFERMVADYVGTRHAVATASGTSALHVALLVAGVQPNDEVLVPTLTFVAPVNAVRYVGAWPVFVDAEPDYWQMDSQSAVDFMDNACLWRGSALYNKATGRRLRAILPVHLLGHPCDMDPLLEAARKYNLVVIEDAAESLGAQYKDRKVGHLGDIGCFSFNGNKVITAGGGGMLVTDNEAWARRAKHLTTQAKVDPVEYVHDEIGYNYRLTNLQAAVGCAQMEQIDAFTAAKRRIASTYINELADIPGLCPMRQASWARSIFWLFTVAVDQKLYGLDSRALLCRLNQYHIQARPLWQPIHLNAPYRSQNTIALPVSENINRSAVSLPSSVGLVEADLQRVVSALRVEAVSG